MPTSSEHRRRVLEHQGRQARQADAVAAPKPEQQAMPLLAEVKRTERKQAAGSTKRRIAKTGQGKLPL